jgi:hypothetical protein
MSSANDQELSRTPVASPIVGGAEDVQQHDSTPIESATAGGEEDVQEQEVSLLNKLKGQMKKKDAALLEHVPLDDIEMTAQADIPSTIPQMLHLGQVVGSDGSNLNLVACMATQGIATKTDGGIPRILFFGHGPHGLTDNRQRFKARDVSRMNTLSAAFAPANANPDILNALIKYVFLAKGAALPAGVNFLGGFMRSLGQACWAYRDVAATAKSRAPTRASTPDATPDKNGSTPSPQNDRTRSADQEVAVVVDDIADIEMAGGLPAVDDTEPPPNPDTPDDNLVTHSSHAANSGDERSTTDGPDSSEAPAITKQSETPTKTPPRSSHKRPLNEYLDYKDRTEAHQTKTKELRAFKTLKRREHQSARMRLDADQEAERKALEGKQAAETQKLEAMQHNEIAEIQRRLLAEERAWDEANLELDRLQENTPTKVWELLAEATGGSPAKRRKMDHAE